MQLARWTSRLPQDGGYLIDGVEISGGNAHHEVVGGIIGQGQTAAVEPVEGDDRRKGESLVALDEGTAAGHRVDLRDPDDHDQELRNNGVLLRLGTASA